MSPSATVPPATPAVPAPVPQVAPATPESVLPAPAAPSVHVRAAITWLAIFPLVSIGMLALGPLMESWHPVLRALLLTLLVVPAAVYLVVPKLFAGYGVLMKRRAQRAATKQP